ncbi:secretion system protein [Natronolimnohabitans sp. A-GB9]|uniref:secretion system protein n=1 Tax=Natronolimnohabitans sp. A-GB9 TaxID=3069757 RepID=UPI0027AE4610|nr:secretion system protein [Natronolimnohabitans sp. A-GB9]MDQ2052728.1 secretion system protein [Natronolimnohabitans sp. A-GB9]
MGRESSAEGYLATLVRSLAALYPATVKETPTDLEDALSFVDSPHDAETIVRAGYGAGIAAVVPPLALAAVGVPPPVALFFLLVTPATAIYTVRSLPRLQAAFRRTEALGETPNLVGRAVLRMQIQPALESAVRFAADTGTGPLSDSLAAHVDRSVGTPRTGMLSFAEEWAEWFPALRRSAHLLAAAQDAPAGERSRTLDRSLAAILDGTRSRMADFTASIRAPTTGLFAFGVMLPLALIALVPTVPMVGLRVNIWMLILLYNVVLPASLVAVGLRLLVRRPVAFPPPSVGHTHPDVPGRLWLRGLWGVLAGIASYTITATVGPRHLAPIVAVGVGLGVALLAVYRPILTVRHYVRDVEEHLTDALYIVGRQVADGESVESAVELAADRVPGETGTVFEHAAGVQRRLQVGVESAFLGPYGALRDVPSPRARGTAALLSIASSEGKPAGRAIVSMADHLEELSDVEAETKRNLAKVTETLDSTAAYFAPLVAGATVGMAAMMTEEDAFTESEFDAATFSAESLALVVGVYLVLLCFILLPLSIALRHGVDRALIGYHVGRALTSSMVLYTVTVAVIDLFL